MKSAGTLTYLTDPSGKLVWVKYNPKGLYIPWNSTCPKFYWYSKLQSYPKELWNTNKYKSKPNLGNSHLLNPLLLKATVFQLLLPYCSQEIFGKRKASQFNKEDKSPSVVFTFNDKYKKKIFKAAQHTFTHLSRLSNCQHKRNSWSEIIKD